tara:strand:- start:283 stop:504 length:222 start_codon:yes stop_codon:yes gene_type:complete
MSLLDKKSVKRGEKFLKDFNQSLKIIVLENSARTAQDAVTALGCEVSATVKSLLLNLKMILSCVKWQAIRDTP